MFKTTLFMLPITFRDTMISHQEDRTQRSIDLMALELALYDRSSLTLFENSRNKFPYLSIFILVRSFPVRSEYSTRSVHPKAVANFNVGSVDILGCSARYHREPDEDAIGSPAILRVLKVLPHHVNVITLVEEQSLQIAVGCDAEPEEDVKQAGYNGIQKFLVVIGAVRE